MTRRGFSGLSFQAIFAAVVVLFVGGGVFAVTLGPSGLGNLQDNVMQMLGILEQAGGYKQIALDSANATRIALSCTAMLNSANPSVDKSQIDGYFKDVLVHEWNNWYGGACRKASTNTPGKFHVGKTGIPRVECDPLYSTDEGETTATAQTNPSALVDDWNRDGQGHAGCKIYNFTLPQLNRLSGTWAEVIIGNGMPHYVMYYEKFNADDIKNDWEKRASRIGLFGLLLGGAIEMVIDLIPGPSLPLPGGNSKILSTLFKKFHSAFPIFKFVTDAVGNRADNFLGDAAAESADGRMARAARKMRRIADSLYRAPGRILSVRKSVDEVFTTSKRNTIDSAMDDVIQLAGRESIDSAAAKSNIDEAVGRLNGIRRWRARRAIDKYIDGDMTQEQLENKLSRRLG
ncbi:MAG: hypothetical protein SVU32_01740, partial [Candidatus Nanohaloarchaea archaeon]|nr:hypothetical protein [Candidatus Nanohaloarchaea archaeon]